MSSIDETNKRYLCCRCRDGLIGLIVVAVFWSFLGLAAYGGYRLYTEHVHDDPLTEFRGIAAPPAKASP